MTVSTCHSSAKDCLRTGHAGPVNDATSITVYSGMYADRLREFVRSLCLLVVGGVSKLINKSTLVDVKAGNLMSVRFKGTVLAKLSKLTISI
jgi:hypothetical protein